MDSDTHKQEREEIDRLLSIIADEGSSQEAISRLEKLLLDRPDLQQHYARAIRLHTLLTHEWSLSHQLPSPLLAGYATEASFSNETGSIETDSAQVSSGQSLLASRAALPSRPLLAGPARSSGLPAGHFAWLLSALAASVMLVLLGNYTLSGLFNSKSRSTATNDFVIENRDTNGSAKLRISDQGMVVRDPESLRMISRLTKTSLLNSFTLPVANNPAIGNAAAVNPLTVADGNPTVTLCSGAVWMQPFPGKRERGYVYALPPEATLEVLVDAESSGQNSLVIVEIDRTGRVTGDAVSFGNDRHSNRDDGPTRIGAIGNWSTFNHTSEAKLYLFTGSHILSDQESDKTWYLSDYRVTLNSEELICIGWDDSGYTVPPDADLSTKQHGAVKPSGQVASLPSQSKSYKPDRDFNDVSATLRIYHPPSSIAASQQMNRTGGVRLIPAPLASKQELVSGEEGYKIAVAPGETVVVRATADAWLPSAFVIADANTRQILWRHDGLERRNHEDSLGNRGTYVIENNSNDNQQYLLLGRHSASRKSVAASWQASDCRVLGEEDNVLMLGFDDSADDNDWNDLQVHARWFRSN